MDAGLGREDGHHDPDRVKPGDVLTWAERQRRDGRDVPEARAGEEAPIIEPSEHSGQGDQIS
jgi:hypothetical protein